uniref:Uncharacterized protein n=1 Tax=Nymphaea colorata TaxID=210225 RepID=A0A5K0ZCD0_9MAGN
MAKGLCYHCDDKWFCGHKCKEIKLFIVIDDEDEEYKVEQSAREEDSQEERPNYESHDDSQVLCHTIANIRHPDPLKVVGYISNHKVLALLDTGSATNFISPGTAQLIGGKSEVIYSFDVQTSDGTHHTCKDRLLHIQNVPFTMDLYILPIHGVDVVLGMQWFRTLGKIQWDFATKTIMFHKENSEGQVVLMAIDIKSAKTIAAQGPREGSDQMGSSSSMGKKESQLKEAQMQKIAEQSKTVMTDPIRSYYMLEVKAKRATEAWCAVANNKDQKLLLVEKFDDKTGG